MNGIKKNVHVIGMQMDLGASKGGVNMGPLAIRYAGLIEKLSELGFATLDKGDIVAGESFTDNQKLKNYKPIYEANKALYEMVSETLKSDAIPVILGGDHCVSAGSATAVNNYYNQVGIIWIDAHGDFNNDISSPSGNMHGMPLSAVCGKGPDSMVDFMDEKKFINPKNVALVGVRDIDNEERKRLASAGINVFSIHEIDQLGMAEGMKRAIDAIKK